MKPITRRSAAVLAASLLFANAPVHATEIVPIDRDSSLSLNLANLGYIPGSTETGEPIVLEETGLTSEDDMSFFGELYYGPDGFGRINSGTYVGLNDLFVEAQVLIVDLIQQSSVAGDASPSCEIDNSTDLLFTVSADSDAELVFEFDGNTNLGNDSIVLILRRVDADDGVLETLFQLAATGLDGSGSGSETVSLLAGERYRLIVTGRARGLTSTGPVESDIFARLFLMPDPCNAADLAERFGVLDLADVSAFVSGFTTLGNESDLNDDGVWDLTDVTLFVGAFNAGCP